MRSIEEIKKELTDAFMEDGMLQELYGFTKGGAFEKHFSRVSLENLLLYIVAFGMWTMEKVFANHTEEVESYISSMKPHTLRWYQEKAKAFLYGFPLIAGSDEFDTTGKSDDDIAKAQVVKFAAVSESSATLYLKVAGESGGRPCALQAEEKVSFVRYLAEYKDAGVRVDVTSDEGDYLRLALDVWYDPLLLMSDGKYKGDGSYPVDEAVQRYIEQLPFNGEYRNNDLVDALQHTPGVVMVALREAWQSVDGVNENAIAGYCVPYAGYFKYNRNGKKTIDSIRYIAYT